MSKKKGEVYVPRSEGLSCLPRAVNKQTAEAEAQGGDVVDVPYCTLRAGQWEA